MTDFEWNPDYAIGHFQIDDEHRKLFRLARKMMNVSCVRASEKEIKAAVKALSDYTKIHFRNEERLMESIGYPDLEKHRAAHAYIIEQISNFLAAEPSPVRQAKRLKEIISTWVDGHTTGEDLKIARFIASRRGTNN